METHVEFRSDAFPPYPEEETEINPGCYGKRLAEYLAASLENQGFTLESEPTAEDWGWAITIANEAFPLWVGCGNYQEYADGFLCFIEPHEPQLRKWFKLVDTRPRVEALRAGIHKALSEHPGVHGLRWWTHYDFNTPGRT